jgi:PilZ domain-containing protein
VLEPLAMSILMPDGDIVVRERRNDVRVIVNLAGRYWLVPRGAPRDEMRQFACRAINISGQAVALAVPVQGKPGQRVLAEIEHFGKLQGTIARLLNDRGFVMRIETSDEAREKLVDKIDWLERHKNLEVSDRRKQARFAPRNPHSTLLFADGSMRTCFVVDLSVTGAAISGDIVPNVGTVIAVGKVVGRVVRHLEAGFAVKFEETQDRATVESLATCR